MAAVSVPSLNCGYVRGNVWGRDVRYLRSLVPPPRAMLIRDCYPKPRGSKVARKKSLEQRAWERGWYLRTALLERGVTKTRDGTGRDRDGTGPLLKYGTKLRMYTLISVDKYTKSHLMWL